MKLEVLNSLFPILGGGIPWYGKLGEGITDEKVQALINAGYGYVLVGGVQSSPITGAGAYVSTTPDMDIKVPDDKAFIPLSILVQYETIGTASPLECFATMGLGGTFATGGTAIIPKNMDVSRGNGSGLLCQSPASSAVLPTDNLTDIWRNGVPNVSVKTDSGTVSVKDHPFHFKYNAKDEGFYHILKGQGGTLFARLNVWAAHQAATAFIIVKGLSIPKEFTTAS